MPVSALRIAAPSRWPVVADVGGAEITAASSVKRAAELMSEQLVAQAKLSSAQVEALAAIEPWARSLKICRLRVGFHSIGCTVRTKYANAKLQTGGTFTASEFIALVRYKELCTQYQTLADAARMLGGCANCHGTETLRSCIHAYDALSKLDDSDGEFATFFAKSTKKGGSFGARLTALRKLLVDDYEIDLAAPFGAAFGREALSLGIQCGGSVVKAMEEPWYGDLKSLMISRKKHAEHLKGVGQGLTKASANAHAVIARATLAQGIVLACVEYATYLAAGAKTAARRASELSWDALDLVAPDGVLSPIVKDEYVWLRSLYRGEQSMLSSATLSQLALALMDRQLRALGKVVSEGPANPRASCFAICTLYRGVLLSLAHREARKAGWSGSKLRPATATAAAQLRQKLGERRSGALINIKGFMTAVASASTSELLGVARVCCTQPADWLNVGEVEFSKQCGECESSQGAFDLVGRFVDSRVQRGTIEGRIGLEVRDRAPTLTVMPRADLDLSVGVVYSRMPSDPIDGATPFDLCCAVACQATALVLAKFGERAKADAVAQGVLSAFDVCGPLFGAYVQTMFLGMGMQGSTALPKVTVEAPIQPVQSVELTEPRALVSVQGQHSDMPTTWQLDEAAHVLGVSLRELMLSPDSIPNILSAYRQQALIVHPDRPLGSTEEFQKLAAAKDKLVSYFDPQPAPSGRLALDEL